MVTLDDIKAKCSNSDDIEPDDCWLWGGYLADGLRPQLWTGEKSLQVRRFVWEQANGPIPPKRVITPKCENRLCVNPDHMAAKSIQQMIRSAAKRGAFKKSEAHRLKIARAMRASQSRLNDEAVQAIRDGELSQAEAVTTYGICPQSYYQIKNGERWASTQPSPFAGLFQGLLREPEPA